MTKIRLQRMEIRNFKKIKKLDLDFREKTCISGENGVGKTSIYKAYYWCLTGKTLEPNEVVQTLDANNEVVHKIDTSVVLVLMIDDSYEVRLERKLVEDWKALGMPNEQLKGTNQQRFYNDIPLSVAEFNAKLQTIADIDKWLLLSNINTFMGLKMEERRKLLMEAAGDINEELLMEPFPALLKAKNVEKKDVDELQKQTLSTRKRANDELKTIPNQISAQDRLFVTEDFDALRKEKESIEAEIRDLDKQLEGSPEELEAASSLRSCEMELRLKITEKTREEEKKSRDLYAEKCKELYDKGNELMNAENDLSNVIKQNAERVDKLATLEERFKAQREQWHAVNAEEFKFEANAVCPTCGHKFTEEEVEERKESAVQHFNSEKSKRLQAIQEEASVLNQQICALRGSINEFDVIVKPKYLDLIQLKKAAKEAVSLEIKVIREAKNEDSEEVLKIKQELAEVEKEIAKLSTQSTSKDDLKEKKHLLNVKLHGVIKKLATENINKKIEEEKEALQKRSEDLSQQIADCDNVLYQIREYKKVMVDAIEEKVNSMFRIAKWKFFKKNTSNDDYMEVCFCTHNGVDYNSTNTADRINLGCDIIYGLSKAFGIESILFVDNKESVAELIQDDNIQLITLEHIPHAPFSINY